MALIDRVFEYEVVVHVETAEDAGQSERVCRVGLLDVLGLSGGGSFGEDHEGVSVEVGMHRGEYFRLVAATLVTSTSTTTTSMSLWVATAVRSIHSGMRMGYEISKQSTLAGYGVEAGVKAWMG